MKIHTIDYKKTYWTHCVYTQTIKIDEELQKKYNSELQKEYKRIEKVREKTHVLSNHDMNILSFTKKLEKGINYLKLTGLWMFFDTCNNNKVNTKNRLKLNRNTIIEVL